MQSPQADLLNANVLWENGEWSLNIWGRNLTDELTVTRGFGPLVMTREETRAGTLLSVR